MKFPTRSFSADSELAPRGIASSVAFVAAMLVAVPVMAVPPPPPRPANVLDLAADNCPVRLTATTQPYAPAPFEFTAKSGDTLLVINKTPNPDLNFNLVVDDESPLISGAGFGTGDVRIRLGRGGAYRIEISAYDPLAQEARAAQFDIVLQLQDDNHQGPCSKGE